MSSPASSSSSSSRRTRPATSTSTTSPSKKQRRGSFTAPLQPSTAENLTSGSPSSKSASSSKVHDMQSLNGTDRRPSISITQTSSKPSLSSKQSTAKLIAVAYSTEYRYCSLRFTDSKGPGGSFRSHGIRQCAAVLSIDVVLPETVTTVSRLDEAEASSDAAAFYLTGDEGRAELYTINAVDDRAGGGSDDMGVFAATHIPQGGVILVERPAVILPADFKLDSTVTISGFEGEDFYRNLLSRGDAQVRREILGLKDCRAAPLQTPEGIFQTNALQVELESAESGVHVEDTSRKYNALFPKTSRCNHSCGPNAIWNFDRRAFTLTLSAARRILPGEEITISYINPFLPRHVRRAQLQSKYNFLCHCVHCDVPWTFPGAVGQSDKARQELCMFFDVLPNWEEWCFHDHSDSKPNHRDHNRNSKFGGDLIEMHLRAMRIRAKEGLEGFKGSGGGSYTGCVSTTASDVPYMKHIDALVMCYGALADVQGFRMWVRKARDVKAAAAGPHSASHVKVLDMWLREPSKFHVWGWKRS